jgi:uncharacterized protein (TIGR04255 family)
MTSSRPDFLAAKPTRLRKAPLVHVLAQVAYSPVLNLPQRIGDIQEELRPLGFLKVTKNETQGLSVEMNPADQGPVVTNTTVIRWDFLDRENAVAVSITEESIVLQSRTYTHFGDFISQLQAILIAVRVHLEITWVRRIGLRYSNLIMLNANETFADYVVPGMLGYPFSNLFPTAKPQGFVTQAAAQTTEGTLVVRSYQVPQPNFLPPDLAMGLAVQYPEADRARFAAECLRAVIDFDHYNDRDQFEFSSEVATQRVAALRPAIRMAFEGAALPYAIDRWGPWEPIEGVLHA